VVGVVLPYVVPALLGFAGVLLGHWLSRRSATELDRWWRREETMRMLRWATEIALDPDHRRQRSGAEILEALLESSLLDPADVELVVSVSTSASASWARAGPEDVPQ
jgi:hypothetical protein